MKKTSKFLVLLAALGMLIGCGSSGGGSSGGGGSEPGGGGGGEEPPVEVSNQINVIYFKSYVSQARANEIKSGLVASLQAKQVEVDAEKVNFFESTNSKVAGFVDEILSYNEDNPSNQIDAILGANGFDNADEESRALFLDKYVSDEQDYTYGTHSNLNNNKNRKYWYDKTKAEDKYVKGLQDYLKENWVDQGEEPPVEESGKLTVFVYGQFVNEERFNELKTGFEAYLETSNLTIANLTFVHETETTTIVDFMAKVEEYDNAHQDAKVDALLGLKTNAAITAAGFSNDGESYNYGTKEGSESDRRYWFRGDSAEIGFLGNYLKAHWSTEPEKEYYLVGDINNWNIENPTLKLTKVLDNQYELYDVDFEAGQGFKIYCPQNEENARWFTNVSTWEGCGFTLSEPDKNIVVTETGRYNIEFNPLEASGDYVVIAKQAEDEPVKFRVALYNKFISDDNITALKQGLTPVLTAAGAEAVEYTELGTGNIADAVGNIVNGTTILLGFKADKNSALANAGYAMYSEEFYNYGTDAERRLWILDSARTEATTTAVFNYLEQNWKDAPVPEYYLVGDMNDWNTESTVYHLTKVDDNKYTYSNLEVEANTALKVYCPQTNTWFNNESTYDGCGYTIGEAPDNNIVITAVGTYNIEFYVTSEFNNHVVLEKQGAGAVDPTIRFFYDGEEKCISGSNWLNEGYGDTQYFASEFDASKLTYTVEPSGAQYAASWTLDDNPIEAPSNPLPAGTYALTITVTANETANAGAKWALFAIKQNEEEPAAFNVALYNKYISDDNISLLKQGVTAALANAGVENVAFTELGTGNVATAFGNVVEGTTVLLGFKGDSNDVMTNAGYAKYDDTAYTYGTDAERRLWILDSARESAEVVAVHDYLVSEWTPKVIDYYLIGTMNGWNQEDTTYKLTKINDTTYKYVGLEVTDEVRLKVINPLGATDAEKWFSDESTWDGCGFTLDESGNVVITGAGTYDITFFLEPLNNNYITVDKQVELTGTTLTVGVYFKFVSADRAQALEDGLKAYLTANGLTIDNIIFEQLGTASENVVAMAGLVTTYNDTHDNAIDVILGANGDSSNALANAGYEKLSDTNYNYGDKDNANNQKIEKFGLKLLIKISLKLAI